MCWPKHSFQPQTQSTTTPSSWTSTQATVNCPKDSILCSDNEPSAFCSQNGKCCRMGAKDFCVCFKEFTGSYCEEPDISYLESQQAKTTISLAVGLTLFMVVIVALVVIVVVFKMRKRNQNRGQRAADVGRGHAMNSVDNNNDSVENGGCATKSSNAADDNDNRKSDDDDDITQQLTQERDRPVNNV